MPDRQRYLWYYDHIGSRFYDILIKWLSLPAGGEQRWRQQLLEPVQFSAGEKILDVCCGTGGATFAIARRAGPDARIVGVDVSSRQIAAAQRKNRLPNVQFVQADAANLPFANDSFDKAFICHALHEMPRDLRLDVLRSARRVLRPTGSLLVLELDVPDGFVLRLLTGLWLLYWLPFNFETATRQDLMERGLTNEVEEAGFSGITRKSMFRGVFQVVIGQRSEAGPWAPRSRPLGKRTHRHNRGR